MATVTATLTPRKPGFLVRYATFHDEPGYAIRTPERAVLFVDHDAHFTALTNDDVSSLVLLGDVSLVERQNVLDTLAGGPAMICTRRKMEVA
jgi:hypothetical protein